MLLFSKSTLKKNKKLHKLDITVIIPTKVRIKLTCYVYCTVHGFKKSKKTLICFL